MKFTIGKKYICAAFLPTFLTACGAESPNHHHARNYTVKVVTVGRYSYGAEVESFHPCGSSNAFWVVGTEETLKPLRDQISQLRKPGISYPEIYAELVGQVDAKTKREGFAQEYNALFVVRTVVRTSTTIPDNCVMKATSP